MNTIHDENKIKGILKEVCYPEEFINGIELSNHIYAMKEYAEYIREKTIDECIACVRNEEQDKLNYFTYNSYKLETITNLTQLKNNG